MRLPVGLERRKWIVTVHSPAASGPVLMVTTSLGIGGTERQLVLLASSLPEPWSASVISLEDGPNRAVLEERGVDVRIIGRRFRYDVSPAARIWRAASEIDPDIVHSWSWLPTAAVLPFCRGRGVPLLNNTIQHGRLPSGTDSLGRRLLALSDAVVANNRAGLAAYGVSEDRRTRVIYNGFDMESLDAALAAEGDVAPHEGTAVIMAARMVPAKDWRLFLDAARALAGDAPGLRFEAVGYGPDRDALLAAAEDLVAAGVLDFPEAGLDVLPTIARADIGVLLTDVRCAAEGLSNSIMEYMACGLPVVATAVGGVPELVDDGVTGLLVPPGDCGAIVSALRALRDDPARAFAMGRQGRERIQTGFSTETMVAGFIAAYESAIAGRRGGRS
jgi:glycosyltransferase involved in cell wall biosynthesis